MSDSVEPFLGRLPMKCPNCGNELDLKLVTEKHLLNGKEVEIEYTVLECPVCRKHFLDYWSLHESIEKAWDKQNDINTEVKT